MKMTRSIVMAMLGLSISVLAGCGGSTAGVHAVAPGPEARMVGAAQNGGQYNLYRASGFGSSADPSHVERVWSVSANGGERFGFHWTAERSHEYAPQPLHLVAFAGSQSRDLGPYVDRDVRYVWAGSEGDVRSYFNSGGMESLSRDLTMR